MPIFTQTLQKVDETNPQEAIKKMVNHIKYLQEQLEYTLFNLDSQHINEINTDKTTITDSTGSTSLGSYINIVGPSGEGFTVGKTSSGKFIFSVKGKNGVETMYLHDSGEIVISEHANLTVAGGEW